MIKIRLARMGRKKLPFYRIVIADAASPRDGKFKEIVGTYNPLLPADAKNKAVFKIERVKYWLSVGAQATERVKFLMNKVNL